MQLKNAWWLCLGLVLIALILVLGVPIVRLSVGQSISVEDASLMAVMLSGGSAYAVQASLVVQEGIEGDDLIQSVTFAAILLSIILTSILILILDQTKLSKSCGRMFSGFGPPLI